MIASATTSSVYGWPALDYDSPLIQYIQGFVEYVARAAMPGAYLVDAFPIMKHIPASLAPWKRKGLEWHANESKKFEGFNNEVSEKIVGPT